MSVRAGSCSSSSEALCRVCGDKASGKHYGVPSCDGCRGFFKRSIRSYRNLDYVCKETGRCVVDVSRRNQCQACRFNKCLQVNMKKDAVQHERAPRLGVGRASLSQQPHLMVAPHALLPPPPPLLYPAALAMGPPAHHTAFHQGLHLQLLPLLQSGASLGVVAPPPATACSSNEDEVTSSEEAKGKRLDLSSLTLLPAENVYESAAKLLFLGVKWARSVPSFLQLPPRDQAILLEESWGELFVLSAAQWALPVEDVSLVTAGDPAASRRCSLEADAHRLKETICRCAQLRVDHTEYACLKALVLFKPECPGLSAVAHVQLLQDQTLLLLLEHCRGAGQERLGRLLLLLPAAQATPRPALEDLFFRRTVGDVSIRRLLGDMLKSTVA